MSSHLVRFVLGIVLTAALLCTAARADDIILNGDFSDGKTHWHGDGDASDVGGKLVVTLKPDKWTVIYQKFSSEASTLKLTVTYSYSDDCSLPQRSSAGAPTKPLTALALEEATGLANDIGSMNVSDSADWTVLLVSGGWNYGQHAVYSHGYNAAAVSPDGSRTFTTTLSKYQAQFIDDALCLAFPPGHGSVTITSVKAIPPN